MGFCLIAETSSFISLNALLNFLYVAIGLGTVIFVHELGHFLVAKACGVKCEKFYIGFDVPIKIFGLQLPAAFLRRRWGETEYGIGVIPLGGYVKMLGQDDNPANYQAEAERTKIRKKSQDAAAEPSAATSTATTDQRDAAVSTAASDAARTAPDAAADASATPATEAMKEPATDATTPEEKQQPAGEDRTAAADASIEAKAPAAGADEYEVDPRSFTAKSVPKRMAIISAGVIFNVIFAVVFATVAYRFGVPYTPCIVGETQPGTAAWEADLNPGDRIVQIGKGGTESQHLRFEMDLLQNIGLTGGKEDLDLLFQDRVDPGTKTWVALRPRAAKDSSDKQPRIGLRAAPSTTLANVEGMAPVFPNQPAAETEQPFEGGDQIVRVEVGGKAIDTPDYAALGRVLAQHPEDELTIVVDRIKEPSNTTADTQDLQTLEMKIAVKPNKMRRAGLIMEMGPIESIQSDSPAEQAGIKVGDKLKTINGEEIVDPQVVPHTFRRLAGKPVTIGVERDNETQDITLTPRPPRMHAKGWTSGSLMGVDAIGIAYPVLNRVQGVEPGSAAAEEGIRPGDRLLTAQFVPANDEQQKIEAEQLMLSHNTIDLGDIRNWLHVCERMQVSLPDTKLKIEYERGEEKREAVLSLVESDDLYVVDRGFKLESNSEIHIAESWGEAFALGRRNTWESLMLVFRFLRKLVTNQISPTSLGGPIAIFAVAGHEANEGISRLLLFLTLLSANLAIINFLPIPVLDGGHMLFLMYEGIFRKPVNELWAMRLTVAGLVFILTLMVFVIGLDIYRFASLLFG